MKDFDEAVTDWGAGFLILLTVIFCSVIFGVAAVAHDHARVAEANLALATLGCK